MGYRDGMSLRRRLVWSCAFPLVLALAFAGRDTVAEEKAAPPTVEAQAEAIRVAVEASDDAALKTLAAMAQPDLEKRKTLVHQVQQIQYERGGMLIWGYADLLDSVSTRVGGAQSEESLFSTWRFEKLWLKGTA